MSKTDIESWIASTSVTSDHNVLDNGIDTEGLNYNIDRALSNWSSFLDYAQKRVVSSKTKPRTSFLQEALLPLAKNVDVGPAGKWSIFRLLVLTYPRYVDKPSRLAVEHILSELVVSGTEITRKMVEWIRNEAAGLCEKNVLRSSAPSDLFILLKWACVIYATGMAYTAQLSFKGSTGYKELLQSMAIFLDSLLDESTNTRNVLRRNAVINTRRALRSSPKDVSTVLSTALELAKSTPNNIRFIPLIGLTCDVIYHLRHVPDEYTRVVGDIGNGIIQLYISAILMSRFPVTTHYALAFSSFITESLTDEDFKTQLLSVMEKAALRSPEVALPVMCSFFNAYSHGLVSDIFRRLVTIVMNSAKSTNPITRTNAINLLQVILKRNPEPSHKEHCLNELALPVQQGKTTGPDHRLTLYSMLSSILPRPDISVVVAEYVPSFLVKESNDAALAQLAENAVPHFSSLLHENVGIPKSPLETIVCELSSIRIALRRAVCSLVGSTLYHCLRNNATDALERFVNAVFPVMEANLKNILSNPLSAPAGPLEGYVGIACLLDHTGQQLFGNGDPIKRGITIQTLLGTSSKPSFLLWERIYTKLSTEEEELWFLRALYSMLRIVKAELLKNGSIRRLFGLALLHLATHNTHLTTRRQALSAIEERNKQDPLLTHTTIHEALPQYLSKLAEKEEASVQDGDKATKAKSAFALNAVFIALATFAEDFDVTEREQLLFELVLYAHHPKVCERSRGLWVELCHRAKVDPHGLIHAQKDKIPAVAFRQELNEARDAAVTTLSFIAPDVLIPMLVAQVRSDLDPSRLSTISHQDMGIWKTPEGMLYVDVLSQLPQKSYDSKGKETAIEKWEAEVRATIATKKLGSSSKALSKKEEELIVSQLQAESQVRKKVDEIYKNAKRGLSLVRSMVASKAEDFNDYYYEIVEILLQGAVRHSAGLFGHDLFCDFLSLGHYCVAQFGSLSTWIGTAILRCINSELVPEHMQEEPLNALILRILYRMRSYSEQNLLDGASFSYLSALLTFIANDEKGYIGKEDEDEPLERIALVISIVNFHAPLFSSRQFPRSQTISNLLHVIRHYPSQTKEAFSTLLSIGETIRDNVTSEEIDILLKATLASEVYVRNAALQCLQVLDLIELDWSPELWISRFDNDQQNARIANHVWEEYGLDVPESFFADLRPFLFYEHSCVRVSCATSLTEAALQWPEQVPGIVMSLQNFYREKAKKSELEYDEYGILISRPDEAEDLWPVRQAVAQALESLASLFPDSLIEAFFRFLLEERALGDAQTEVRTGLLNAASKVIDFHGIKHLPVLIRTFEEYLATNSAQVEVDDYVKEAAVILLGRIARHLDPGDPRVPSVVSRLVQALKTPSEQVQIAVSECLAPLSKLVRPTLPKLVDGLYKELFNAPKYGERRGAAYGLAGVIKGIGIVGIKEFKFVERLRSVLEDKKCFEPRQGAMFAIETMSATIGRNFEPYIIELLPSLLASFGDATPDVREAAEEAAKVIMKNLSGYGVKRLLPILLAALEEKQWRTKKGSIDLLGTMAFCAPKQLSISLPTVIPQLTGVLTDSHAQVRAAANRSLKQFGEVISNPEIQSLVPVLLKALVDPAKTPGALGSLLKKSFIHYIDAPSLAIVIPIVERGLRERGSDVKRKASQIVGNLASLTDSQDFIPYLSKLLPLVHVVLVDPVPEARATAAKALGTLIERLGEEQFPDMVPNLLRTLKTNTSGVDRQGSAQGLSEVLAGLGIERLEALLPDIVSNAQSPRSTVREGFMSLLVYLPATFGLRFQPHLTKIVTPILSGLSDTEEYVREAAMKAGRMIITNYSNKAVELLLPELERRMFDSSWRIRHSSITLVGELLFKVTGVNGKAEVEEDEEAVMAAPEISRKALDDSLDKERRDRVLAALYIVRQDAASVVRQSAIHIWKLLVHNTPRTVRELLPELVGQLVSLLVMEESVESQETASRTFGELCRKFGERILGEILPILRSKSKSHDRKIREGVCLALCGIMENATETQRENHDHDIVDIVRAALVDDESNVRTAAARAFDSLQEHLGAKAIDQTIPTLLEALRQPGVGSETALQALKEVMNVRANAVFPVLIPTLLAAPMTVFNAYALASLVRVAGNALSKRLTQVLGALIVFSESNNEPELEEALGDAIKAMLGSISDAEGLNTLMMLLLEWIQTGGPIRRASACRLFGIFCEESELDDSLYRVDWIRQLIRLMDDAEVIVHTAALQALDQFVKSVPKDEIEPLVVALRRSIESTGAPGRFVPGFSLPKGISPMVAIILAGLTTGSNEQRENAANAIGDLIIRTEENAIKPFVVLFTGPLIRVAAQSATYPPGVKSAILSSLATMLERIPMHLKPFYPQLQRTFIKSLSDASSLAVRGKAATALGVLMKSQQRVDPVITELITGVKNNEDAIAASHVGALALVVKNAGENVGEKAREACVELIEESCKESHDDHYVEAAGQLFAALSKYPLMLRNIIKDHLLPGTPVSPLASYMILAALTQASDEASLTDSAPQNLFQELSILPDISRKVLESVSAGRPSVSRPAREAKDLLKNLSLWAL